MCVDVWMCLCVCVRLIALHKLFLTTAKPNKHARRISQHRGPLCGVLEGRQGRTDAYERTRVRAHAHAGMKKANTRAPMHTTLAHTHSRKHAGLHTDIFPATHRPDKHVWKPASTPVDPTEYQNEFVGSVIGIY